MTDALFTEILRDNKEDCPHCGADLQADAIPEEDQHLYGATHFSRKIGIYDTTKDRTIEWLCPFCGGHWPRGGGVSPGVFRSHG